MKIKLVKYSSFDNSAILITDKLPTGITITDPSGTIFYLHTFTTTETENGFVQMFSTLPSNVYSMNGNNIDMTRVSIVTAHGTENDLSVVDTAAVYDEGLFVSTKIDMMNSIIKDGGAKGIYKEVVKFLFLESGMNDIAKHNGNVADCLQFYSELIKIRNGFKTKYHYNDQL